ncbi:MAG: hypothetical protein JWN01_399 [Patescibacteria group bacterium]|nr:hypothetical protein [Patescibacteria group bacterium]
MKSLLASRKTVSDWAMGPTLIYFIVASISVASSMPMGTIDKYIFGHPLLAGTSVGIILVLSSLLFGRFIPNRSENGSRTYPLAFLLTYFAVGATLTGLLIHSTWSA